MMTEEVERVRMLESKAFQEKEQLRSKLEELYEEKERTCQVHLCVGFYEQSRSAEDCWLRLGTLRARGDVWS